MADEEKDKGKSPEESEEEEDTLLSRFPDVPPMPELPDAPVLKPKLPPHPAKPQSGSVEPGSYNKMALAATAASSFITPIIVLSVAGWYLDKKAGTSPWGAFGGVVLGFIVGISALLRVMRRLGE